MANAIVANIPAEAMETTIEKVELSKIGNAPGDKAGFFLNIFLKEQFVLQRLNSLVQQNTLVLEQDGEEEKKDSEA